MTERLSDSASDSCVWSQSDRLPTAQGQPGHSCYTAYGYPAILLTTSGWPLSVCVCDTITETDKQTYSQQHSRGEGVSSVSCEVRVQHDTQQMSISTQGDHTQRYRDRDRQQ